jgi:dihydroorotase
METKSQLITNATLVNEGDIYQSDVLIRHGRIEKIAGAINASEADEIHDLAGMYLLPGLIDDQVHFREPGLTHKAEIYTEARAAVAGGITSYMEMPNTQPQSITQELLARKYERAAEVSLANYSFYMGATNDNLEEVLKTDPENVCGVKIFMGASTGNMLVDDMQSLESLFSKVELLIATHCEFEPIIRENTARYVEQYGDDIPMHYHPEIRSREACYRSSSMAIELAKKYGTRLHILHISTAEETELFEPHDRIEEKKITAEACIHHLWFDDNDYENKGALIKWNPAVKNAVDREAIWQALKSGAIDVIATDHAPHTLAEKQQVYTAAPSGGPLVQHSLVAMLDKHHDGLITLPFIVAKMCHNPARLFHISNRGFLREGYFADLVAADLNSAWTVEKQNILYKCGWSPFEGHRFRSQIKKTWVSGNLVYDEGVFIEGKTGMRLTFESR